MSRKYLGNDFEKWVFSRGQNIDNDSTDVVLAIYPNQIYPNLCADNEDSLVGDSDSVTGGTTIWLEVLWSKHILVEYWYSN